MTGYQHGMHKPAPGRKTPTGLHHIAPHPMKTGMSSSGGGTTKSGGMVKTSGGGTMTGRRRKRGNFSMPMPDRHGYY